LGLLDPGSLLGLLRGLSHGVLDPLGGLARLPGHLTNCLLSLLESLGQPRTTVSLALLTNIGASRFREGTRWRYRYAQEAQRDLEEATTRAAELRERLGELREETERRQGQQDAPAEDNLEVERTAAAEDLARAEGLARAAETLLSRPDFAFRDRAQFEERVLDLARAAVEESEKLRRAVGETFEHGERELREAAEKTGPELPS
jgi:hypothetical protein